MYHKQPKMDTYWLSKPIPITNTFEGFEKEFDDINVNARMEKIVKQSTVFSYFRW